MNSRTQDVHVNVHRLKKDEMILWPTVHKKIKSSFSFPLDLQLDSFIVITYYFGSMEKRFFSTRNNVNNSTCKEWAKGRRDCSRALRVARVKTRKRERRGFSRENKGGRPIGEATGFERLFPAMLVARHGDFNARRPSDSGTLQPRRDNSSNGTRFFFFYSSPLVLSLWFFLEEFTSERVTKVSTEEEFANGKYCQRASNQTLSYVYWLFFNQVCSNCRYFSDIFKWYFTIFWNVQCIGLLSLCH